MLDIQEVTDDAALAGLESDWRALHDASGTDSVFLGFDWLRAWWTHLGGRRNQSLYVLVAREEGHAQAILPLMCVHERRRGLVRRTLRFLGSGISDRLGMLARPGASDAAEAFAEHLRLRGSKWDRLELVDLAHDDADAHRLAEALEKHGLCDGLRTTHPCPFVPISGDGSGDWETFYHARISAKTRSNNRNKTRRLERQGELRIRVVEEASEVPDALEKIFAMDERDAYHGEPRRRPFDDEAGQRFFREVAAAFAERGWLYLALMELDDALIAYRINFRYRNRHFDYFVGYSPAHNRYSPGRLLAVEVLRDCFASGLERLDLLRGFEDWKREWTDVVRDNAEIVGQGPSMRSRLHALLQPAGGTPDS